MLPKDAEQCCKDDKAKSQASIDPHLSEMPRKEVIIPYSDNQFRKAAIEWIASTDQVCKRFSTLLFFSSCVLQPIQALEHPSFQKMIQIAACATKPVNIPDHRQTRQGIINMFKQQLFSLRDNRLNVRGQTLLFCLSFLMYCSSLGKVCKQFDQPDLRHMASLQH